MGLIKATINAADNVFSSQWKSYIKCNAMPAGTLAVEGIPSKQEKDRESPTNIITNGSVIAVADGQFMLIVSQGDVVDYCAEPGAYIFDASTEPSVFSGEFGDGLKKSFEAIKRNITFGGVSPTDYRVYYFNTKEMMGNRFGTANPIPFRIIDSNIDLELDANVRGHGMYSYIISDPLLFYRNVCGNFSGSYRHRDIEAQLNSELLAELQMVLGNLSERGIRYSVLPSCSKEINERLQEQISEVWEKMRGIKIVSVSINLKIDEEDEAMIKQLQFEAPLQNPNMLRAHLGNAEADAMRGIARNECVDPMIGYGRMYAMRNIAGNLHGNSYYFNETDMRNSWVCPNGHHASGNFCSVCGTQKP